MEFHRVVLYYSRVSNTRRLYGCFLQRNPFFFFFREQYTQQARRHGA